MHRRRRRGKTVVASGALAAGVLVACIYSVPGVVDDAGPVAPHSDGAAERDAPDGPDADDADARPVSLDTGTPSDGLPPACSGGIAFAGSTQASSATLVAAITVPAPASVPGDLLLAVVSYGNDTVPSILLTPPAGWTLAGQTQDSSAGGVPGSLYVAWKLAGAAEPSSYEWTAASPVFHATWILRYAGVDPAHPLDTQAAAPGAAASSAFLSPTLTTTGPGELIVASFGVHTQKIQSLSTPSGMTQRALVVNDGGRGGASSDEVFAEAGLVGPFATVVISTGSTGVQNVASEVLALRPCR